jgi:hypothetical protein
MRYVLVCLAGLAVMASAGCNRGLRTKRAVEEAIDAHLKQRSGLRMQSMTTEIVNVQFHGDTADADVRFSSKESAQTAVTVRYTLRQAGDHWVVESSSQQMGSGPGTNPHEMPAGAPSPPPPAPTTAPNQPAPEASH